MDDEKITFHQAIKNNDLDSVLDCLEYQSETIDDLDAHNRTPLMVATRNNHIKFATLLLNAKCDVNKTSGPPYYSNALIIAIDNNYLECAKLLLQHKADPTLQDFDGKTALYYCQSNESRNILLSMNLP